MSTKCLNSGMLDFSQRWERGKVSLLLLTFSHPSVPERWFWMVVVKECHEEHAYVPKHRTSACRHEEVHEGHEDGHEEHEEFAETTTHSVESLSRGDTKSDLFSLSRSSSHVCLSASVASKGRFLSKL